jgi:hypothetical protein
LLTAWIMAAGIRDRVQRERVVVVSNPDPPNWKVRCSETGAAPGQETVKDHVYSSSQP